MPEVVTTKAFWALMCDARAVRLSLHAIKICNAVYVTLIAPEEEPGFMDRILTEIRCAL